MESGKQGLPGGRSSTCKSLKVGARAWSAEGWGGGGPWCRCLSRPLNVTSGLGSFLVRSCAPQCLRRGHRGDRNTGLKGKRFLQGKLC